MVKELVNEIKELIITSLNLEDMKPSDIDENAPLFNDGLGLDSVDALELGLAVQKKYGLVLDSKSANLKEIFFSVSSLAKYIYENRK
ncbi:acyl carrier protein [Campylobacter concisus]|uniref:Acyl carrier protein n=1 Tax=Campylobacter concisus TaxID=199 RepID=A0A0M4TLY7_9BACT|nr:phosphopantetheine-binding protein [Campylobacter concisus]ALF47114.1 acyl carrier protein [Campylobacter concisus]